MAIFAKSDEERAASAQAKEHRKEARQQGDFLASAVGQAKTACAPGDDLFQVSFSAEDDKGPFFRSGSKIAAFSEPNGPIKTLNAIRREGWELVTASFVHSMHGSSHADADGGASLNISGSTFGYYIFRRAEDLRVDPNDGQEIKRR